MGADVKDHREGGRRPHTHGNLYRAVVQATLLFGAETWVMSPMIGRTLGGFHLRMPPHMA